MYQNYEDDMIYKIISDHFMNTGNLEPEEIKAKILAEKVTISLTSIQSRIDEFKRTKAYKDSSENNTNT
jgi:hypothetical protein